MAKYAKRPGLPFAVIDNTLLTRLVKLEIAIFLPWVYKGILIPPEVKREVARSPGKGKRRLRSLMNEMTGYFVDCREADEFIKDYLKADLDEGEASAIAQAHETKSHLLIDEKPGFERAIKMEVTAVRTGRLINNLKSAGAIVAVKPYLEKLRALNFRITDDVIKQLLAEAGEE